MVAITCMSFFAFLLVLAGSLEVILEFGSVTFLLVSLLMAFANDRIRDKTRSSRWLTRLALVGLAVGTLLILYYEFTYQPRQLLFIVLLYGLLTVGSWIFSRRHRVK